LCYVPYAEGRILADKPTEVYDLEDDPYQFRNLEGEALPQEAVSDQTLLREWDLVTPWMGGIA